MEGEGNVVVDESLYGGQRPLRCRLEVTAGETKMFSIWMRGQGKPKSTRRAYLLAESSEGGLCLIGAVKVDASGKPLLK